MKEEHGICARGKQASVDNSTMLDPLPTIWRPPHPGVAGRWFQPKRAETRHIPSQNKMRSRMRSRNAFKIRLEVDIIPTERVHGEFDVFFRERRVEHQVGVDGGTRGSRDQPCIEG